MERSGGIKEQLSWEKTAPSLKFGLVSGILSAPPSALYALYRSHNPPFFTFASALTVFTLGTTFHYSRSQLLHHRPFSTYTPRSHPPTLSPTQFDLLTSSACGGAIAGGLTSLLFRRPSGKTGIIQLFGRRILPSTLQMALLGYVGQNAWIWLDERHSRSVVAAVAEKKRVEAEGAAKANGGIMDKIAGMEWTGLRRISDEDYAGMLGEKIVAIEAEVALIEEEIERIRRGGMGGAGVEVGEGAVRASENGGHEER